MEELKILNSHVEFALRGLIILERSGMSMSARKVSLIDFMVTHAHDFYKKAESVHADSPFRTGEWISRTSLFDMGLRLLVSRSLVELNHTHTGIYFLSTELSSPFLEYIDSDYKSIYYSSLSKISKAVIEADEEKLYKQLKKRVGEWKIGAIEN